MTALKAGSGKAQLAGGKDAAGHAYAPEELAGLELDFGLLEQLHGGGGHRDTLAAPDNAKKYAFADTSSDDDDGELTERSEKAQIIAPGARASFQLGGVLNVDQMASINKGKAEIRRIDEEVEMARLQKMKSRELENESKKMHEENPYAAKQEQNAESEE